MPFPSKFNPTFGGRSAEPEPKAAARPARCPHCGASDVVTTSKIIDANSYWRCQTCGEVWNIDRRGSASRFGFRR